MIIKSGSLLYLFDFDGTIAGSSKWRNLLWNNFSCYKSHAYINPSSFDIRWCILTGRPKIDRMFIKTFCVLHGLAPERIFTLPTLFWNCENEKEVYEEKYKIIAGILEGVIPVGFTPLKIEKIFYIDNCSECNKYLNSKKGEYRYLCISVADFYKQNISPIVI